MLVLTRKLNQTITIGHPNNAEAPLEVTIIEVRGDQVRLGVAAPRGVVVDRREIWEQKQQENRASAAGGEPLTLPAKSK